MWNKVKKYNLQYKSWRVAGFVSKKEILEIGLFLDFVKKKIVKKIHRWMLIL